MATGRPGDRGDPASQRAGWVLDTLRRLRNLTRTELASKAGVSRTTLDAKLAGASSWTLADVEAFADALEVPAAVFQFDEDAFWVWWSTVGRG